MSLKKIKILRFILISTIIMSFISCSVSNKIVYKNITGRIYALGNEPFIKYGIEDAEGTVYIIMKESPVYQKLKKLQGNFIKVIVNKNKSSSWDHIYVTNIVTINKKE